MKITVCNREFEIRESAASISNVVVMKFHVDIDGEVHTLAAEYIKPTIVGELDSLPGITVEDSLREILKQDVRLEIFKILKKVNVADIQQGKYPELISEWVKDFGAEDLAPEVQEKYIDIIAEAMRWGQ